VAGGMGAALRRALFDVFRVAEEGLVIVADVEALEHAGELAVVARVTAAGAVGARGEALAVGLAALLPPAVGARVTLVRLAGLEGAAHVAVRVAVDGRRLVAARRGVAAHPAGAARGAVSAHAARGVSAA